MKQMLKLLLIGTLIMSGRAFATSLQVCVVSDKSCQSQVINKIERAKKSVRIQARELYAKKLIAALVKAKKEGVNVKVIMDQTGVFDHKKTIKLLQDNKIILMIDSSSDLALSNHIIVDDNDVLIGSAIFSDKKNMAGDILFINDDPRLLEKYTDYFRNRLQASETMEHFCKHSVQCKFNQATSAAKRAASNVWESTKGLLHNH